ncbi:HNHc domain-containing protein [Mycena indigotica]|uniref:HNHc domain-containing protein n=1 Tax=Mycena indigotica TaxID=2126181 RepID=A0A8H6S1Q4_9AGAR|nr:HNHc domain-containing protein [Mycena indigotica]KAF7290610.1 HNHc domain-containing protein [Mycena indigotica]
MVFWARILFWGDLPIDQFRNIVRFIEQNQRNVAPQVLKRDDVSAALPGQYLFFLQTRNGLSRAFSPSLRHSQIISRSMTRSASPSPSATLTVPGTPAAGDRRDTGLRKIVRQRDFCCRASGTIVPTRGRGPNYQGFNMCHVFPFGLRNQVLDIIDNNDPAIPLLSGPHGTEVAQNALLFRTDLHDFFDNYQFSFNGATLKIYTFERDGAPTLGTVGLPMFPPLPEAPGGVVNGLRNQQRRPNGGATDVHRHLLRQHFETAVLWHFTGYGRARGQ